MEIWNAHYRDSGHDLDINISNSQEAKGDTLLFCIDGFEFTGTSLGDFELKDPNKIVAAKKHFCFLDWGGHISAFHKDYPYHYFLQRYSLSVELPVHIIRNSDQAVIQGLLHVAFELKKAEKGSRYICDDKVGYYDKTDVNEFSLTADGKIFSAGKKSLYFENSLMQIHRQLSPGYCLKCCFSCQYSDYSPYGNDDFGSMLCYKRHKSEYLKVNDKDGFFEFLEPLDFDMRQETFLCGEYEPRTRCGGYRGFLA